MSDSEIFDRQLRRARRDRAATLPQRDDRLLRWMSEDILDRLRDVRRDFATALVFNGAATALVSALRAGGTNVTVADPGGAFARQSDGLMIDEDRHAFAERSFDLIVSIGLLDTVNDVPGALVLMLRALKPGGLMFASFLGAESFMRLRTTLRAVEPMVQRVHPMIDVRAGGDLLARAGFAQSVADVDEVTLRCADAAEYYHLLRSMVVTNLLTSRQPLRRATTIAWRDSLESQCPIEDVANIVTLTGWAPPSE